MRTDRMVAACVVGLGVLLSPALVVAEESGSSSRPTFDMMAAPASGGGAAAEDKWHFSVTPLSFWGMNIEGPLCVKGVCREVNASFGDVKEAFDGAAGIGFEFGKGSWGGFINASRMKFLEGDVEVDTSLGPTTADIELEWTTVEGGVAYRMPMAGSKSPKVQVLGGVRYEKLKLSAFSGPGAFDESTDKSWTDPFVGLSLAQPFAKNFAYVSRADVGGFGVSSDSSKLTWNFVTGLAYQWKFTGWGLSAFGGYKWSELDYRAKDPNELQIINRFSGPVVTVSFNW